MGYIDKNVVIAELNRLIAELVEEGEDTMFEQGRISAFENVKLFLDTLEVKEVGLTDMKTEWSPNKKQMESLKDMLKYNIGVFDYQKFMEVNSLYNDLKKILDYETDRQK